MVCVVNACASVRLCRSLPSFAFHLASPVIRRERASHRERDGSMQFQPGAARATVRACRVRKHIHPTWCIRMVTARPAEPTRDSSSEWPLPADSGEPASMPAASSLCYAYGMHASRRQQQACVWESRRRWHICVRCHGNRCDLIEVTAPNGFRLPLAACSNYLGMSCVSADPRAPGCPWATAGATVESHVAQLCKFEPPMCSLRSRTGHGHALRLMQLAAR